MAGMGEMGELNRNLTRICMNAALDDAIPHMKAYQAAHPGVDPSKEFNRFVFEKFREHWVAENHVGWLAGKLGLFTNQPPKPENTFYGQTFVDLARQKGLADFIEPQQKRNMAKL